MGSISAGDQVLLRQPVDTQKSVERLYLFGFPDFWTGRVNESPARGDRTITFDGGAMAAGFAWADLDSFDEGLEVWFGSTSGGKEHGTRRLRSITSSDNGVTGTIAIDWHDDMNLSDDDYITIKHFYPPWPKYSWFTATGPEFRKDGPDGTLYAASGDANDTPAPHVVMGRNYAGELTGASITIQCDASNSEDVAGGGGAVTYAWDITPAAGASFDDDTSATPVLTVTTEGNRWLHCTVTIDGRSTTAHRAVIVGGGITEFSRTPITTKWDNTSVQCQITLTSPESGASGEVRPVMTWADAQDHALVTITSEDYYGSTQKAISMYNESVYTDRDHVAFCGYLVLENDDLVEDGTGQVTLTAISLVDMFLYSLSLTGVTDADEWYEMNQDLMTVAGNLLHLFRWQSTLLDIADWWLPWDDTVRRSANEEFSEGDMLERARALARARIMGITANAQGEIFVETDLNVRSEADRGAATTTMTGTDADIAGTKRVRKRRRGETVRVLADGGYSTGVMGSFQPFFAASANVARAEGHTIPVHVDRLMLPNQTETNRIAARLAAVANRSPYEVDLEFSGNYWGIFSPAPQQWYNLGNLFAGTLKANISGDTDLVDALVVPREVTHSHDPATGHTTVSVVFDVEAPVELAGRTITPPAVPSEDPDDGTWDFPDPPAWPVTPGVVLTGSLLGFDGSNGAWRILPDMTDWEEINDTLAGADIQDQQGGWDPWWFTPSKKNTHNPYEAILWKCDVGKVFRSTDCGETWMDASTEIPDPPNSWDDDPAPTVADVTFVQRVDSIHQNGLHIFVVTWTDPVSGGYRSWLLSTDNDGVTGSWSWQSLGGLDAGGSSGTYYPVNFAGLSYSTAPADRGKINYSNVGALTDEPDSSGAEFDYEYLSNNGYEKAQLDVDFGGQLDGVTIKVRVRAKQTPAGANYLWPGGFDNAIYSSTDGSVWNVVAATVSWAPKTSGYSWGSQFTFPVAAHPFRYLRFTWSNTQVYDGAQGWIDAIEVTGITSASAGEITAIWADVDTEDGSVLWLTTWHDDELWLQKRATDGLWLMDEYSLGSCTAAQLVAGTYVAYPFTPTFDKDTCYVFGRMQGPQSLHDPAHLIRTTDGGDSWTLLEGGWGSDVMNCFQAVGDTGAARIFHAVRNLNAGGSQFYYGNEILGYRSDTSFGARGVNVNAMSIGSDAQIAIGADGAGAIMITESTDTGANWTDITGSYPATGEVKSLVYA